MNELLSRVKRLEQRAEEKTDKRFAYCFIEPDEDEEEAEKKWREQHPDEEHDLMVYIVQWANEKAWPPPPKHQAEIEEGRSEAGPSLDEQGFVIPRQRGPR